MLVNTICQIWITQSINIWSHDEFFHISHSVQFYFENYEYNEYITTPPGLYLLGKLFLNICEPFRRLIIQDQEQFAKEKLYLYIRHLNSTVLGTINFILLCKIIASKYELKRVDTKVVVFVLCIVLTPLYYPMHIIYYTEIGSMTYCLLCYYLVNVKQIHLAKPAIGHLILVIIGICGFMQRQTNVIWFNYIAVVSFIHKNEMKIKEIFGNLITHLIDHLWLILIDGFFIGFYIWNGNSIVIGDRDHHPPILHSAQLLYLTLFLIACIPVPIHEKLFAIIETLIDIWNFKKLTGLVTFIFLTAIFTPMVSYGTFSHIFIQNNRGHYSYDFNQTVIENQTNKTLLIPVYAILSMSLYRILKQYQPEKCAWIAGIFVLASAMTLFPCQLFELRYYLHSVFLISLELFNSKTRQLGVWIACLIYCSFFVLHEYRDHPLWFPVQSDKFL